MVDNVLKTVVGHNGESVYGRDTYPLAIGQSQATPDGLLHQGARIGGPQGHDGIEVGNIPALFEHVHVDDDFDGVVRLLDSQQLLHDLVLFLTTHVGMDGDHFAAVATLEEGVTFETLLQGIGVCRVLGDHQHERLDYRGIVIPGVYLQLDLGVLMDTYAIFELDLLQPVRRVVGSVKVFPCGHCRLFHKTVVHGQGERIAVDHVFEGAAGRASLHLRCRGQFQSQDRHELVDGPYARRGPVAMRFIHEHHQIVQLCQIIEVALANVLGQPLDARGPFSAHFGIDFGDIEHVDMDVLFEAR